MNLHLLVESSEENHPLYPEDKQQSDIGVVTSSKYGNSIKKVNESSEDDIDIVEKGLLIADRETNGIDQLENHQETSPKQINSDKFSSVRDLKAMSVASVYDKENQEIIDVEA